MDDLVMFVDNITRKQVREFKRWIKALRSGDFKQGTGKLYNCQTTTHCCLGVAAELKYGKSRFRNDKIRAKLPGIRGCTSLKNQFMIDNYGFEIKNAGCFIGHLIHLNDDGGCSFPSIADYLEAKIIRHLKSINKVCYYSRAANMGR